MDGVKLVGTGSALPSRTVTNNDLAQIVDTSDEWIRTRTGIGERHYCTPDETSWAACALRCPACLTATPVFWRRMSEFVWLPRLPRQMQRLLPHACCSAT